MVVTDLRSNVVKGKTADLIPGKTTEKKTLRRIISEDPDWSLATVPLLKDVAINHIVQNFQGSPIIVKGYCVGLCFEK